jgi:hypothetical protein
MCERVEPPVRRREPAAAVIETGRFKTDAAAMLVHIETAKAAIWHSP